MGSILIAGCGDVGSALGRRLVARGRVVHGLRRRPEGLPAGVRPIAADLRAPETLRQLPPDVSALVYAASADGRSPEAYRAAYVDGLRHVLAALEVAASPLERVIFTSSTAVYGQHEGEWVDEASPTEPETFTGKILLEAEALTRSSVSGGVVLRLGGIYGRGRTRLLEQVARGERRLPRGIHYTNRIHVEDCAGALDHLLALDAPEGTYLGVDSEPAPLGEVIAWLAARLGAPPPQAAEPGEDPALERGAGSKRCSNARLVASGYAFHYPSYREGYAALIAARTR